MVNYATLNGNTYSDGNSDEGTGKKYLGNGGHKDHMVPMMSDFITEANNKIAATGASLNATSTSSMTVGSTGSKSFTMEVNKGFGIGQRIRVARTSALTTTWMEGIITAFNQSSGATTFTADTSNGSGTHTDWTITVAGSRGAAGASVPSATTSGTSTAYTATFSPALTAHTNDLILLLKMHVACGASPTFSPDGLSPKAFKKADGSSFNANEIKADQYLLAAYDGTNYQVLGGASGGGETLVTPVVGAGSAQTLNYANGNVFDLTGTASTACTLSFSNLPPSGTVARGRIIWRQPAVTGGATLIFPGSAKWLGQPAPQTTAPTLNTLAGYVHEIDYITVDGGTTIYFYLVGGVSGTSPSATAGLYIAVGSNGKLITSPDGVTWTAQAQQFSGASILAIKHVNGRFHFCSDVAADSFSNCKYTTNGTTFNSWSGGSTGVNKTVRGFVASNTNRIMVFGISGSSSSQGVLPMTNDGSNNVSDLAIGGTSGLNLQEVLTATDNTNWIVCRKNSGSFDYSTNGTGFQGTTNNHSTVATTSFVGYLNGYWLIGSQNGSIHYKTSVSTTSTTEVSSVVGSVQCNKIIWSGSKWVAAFNAGKIANASSIGTWSARTTTVTGNIVDIEVFGGVIMAVTDLGEIIRSTDHGDTWTTISGANNPFGGSALKFIKYRLTKWWTGGAGGKLAQSSDGLSFALVTSNASGETINDFDAV